MKKIRVFHVEDYKIMRDGIQNLMDDDPEVVLVGASDNGPESLRALDHITVDVVIMDIYLDAMEDRGAMNGFLVAQRIRGAHPHIKIIAHSMFDDAYLITQIFNAGVSGFVSKKSGFDELLKAIQMV